MKPCIWVLSAVLLAISSASCGEAGAPLARVDFRELPLAEALRILSEETGLNIVASAEARKVPVSLFLRNVSAQAAIQELARTHDLGFKQDTQSGIYRLMTLSELQRDLVSVRDEKTEVITLLYPNAVSVAMAVRDLFGDRVQLSLGEEGEEESRDLQQRFERFDVVDQRSQGLGIFQSGGAGTIGGAGNSRFNQTSFDSGFGAFSSSRAVHRGDVLRDQSITRRQETDSRGRASGEYQVFSPEQAEAIQKLIQAGKSTPEAERALNAFRRQPADIFVAINRRNNLLMVRTSDAQIMKEIQALAVRLDVPTPLVLLEVKVLSVELGDGFNSVFDYQFSDGVNNAGDFTTGDILAPPADILSGMARRLAPLALGGSGLRAGDLTFQYVNDNFRARIQMLDTKNRITVLATPLLLTANNEVSRLFVGEERPIIRNISSQTVVNDNTTTSVPNTTVEFRPVGTTLLITPNINSDRTVTLRILQENSSINPSAATIPVVTSDGDVRDQAVDVVATRTVTGMVVAKDKLTVAVGGLIEDGVRDSRSQVPILGKIPVLGIPFRRVNNGRSRRELVILVRPQIISTPSEGEAISREVLGGLVQHPNGPIGDGAMKAFDSREILKPSPATNQKDAILRLDSFKHEDD